MRPEGFCDWCFARRAVYSYYGVPGAVYEGLLGSVFKGEVL